MTGMTLTPIAGTYKISFSSSFTSNAAALDAIISVSLYVGGVQVAHSVRTCEPTFSSGLLAGSQINAPLATQAMATVNGSQAIEVRWKITGGGTATVLARALDVFRMWT